MSCITYEDLYKIGRELYDLHRFPQATKIFERLNRLQPKNALVLAQLSRCWWMNNRYNRAKRYALRAYRLNPDLAEPWVIFGNHEFDESMAKLYYEKAIRLNPRFEVAWTNLGNVFLRKGDFKTAKTYYLKALDICPDYEYALLNLGSIYSHDADFPAAKSCIYRALSHWPEFEMGWYQLGELYRDQRDYSSAEACYRKALRLDPTDPAVRHDLIRIYRNDPFYSQLFRGFDMQIIVNQSLESEPSLALIIRAIEQGTIPERMMQYPWLHRYFDFLSKICQRSALKNSVFISEMEAAAWNLSEVQISSHFRIFL